MIRLGTTLLALALASSCQAAFYNAASDFSKSSNPNGVWSYGYSTTLGGAFTLYTTHGIYQNVDGTPNGLDAWNNNIRYDNPAVVHNGTNNTITYNNSATYVAGQLGLHPGPNGEYSIVRFTAPTATTYSLASAFSGLDFTGPTTTDVHVLLNGLSIFDGSVNAFGAGPSLATTLTLNVGDHVDFEVGYGANRGFLFDSTGLAATFSTGAVPEPSSVLMVGVGIGSLVIYRRRWTN